MSKIFCWLYIIDTSSIINNHKYLMKETGYKIMFGVIKKMFIVLLTSLVNASSDTKYVSLSNKKCKVQPSLINLHLNEYCQELHYYPLSVNLDKCVGICNTLNNLSNKVCGPN